MDRARDLSRPPDSTFVVSAESEGLRLDLLLSLQVTDWSRSRLKKLIQDGFVLVNDRISKPSYEVRSGDTLSVWLPVCEVEDRLEPQSMPLDVLYEDDDIIVINKEPGLVVHPGAGHREGTLVHGLLAHCSRLAVQGAPLRPGIVHRLDQDTSGALVIAKSELAYLHLVAQFKEHRVRKEYLALVYGRFAQPGGEIRTSLDRHPKDRKKMAVVQKRGREAVSHWRVEREYDGEVTLLRVVIETGRTHQIRVHLSHLHHPVVGDATYGGGKHRAKAMKSKGLQQLLLGVDRQMLHAWRLAFDHPRSGTPLHFTAPLPHDFSMLLHELNSLFSQDQKSCS